MPPLEERLIGTTRGKGARRGVRILAKSLYRALRKQGYTRSDAVAFATDLLDLIHEDLAEERMRRC